MAPSSLQCSIPRFYAMAIIILALGVALCRGEAGYSAAAGSTTIEEAGMGMMMMEEEEGGVNRLLLGGSGGYISYGVLTADRTICPPMSGRSYYLPNCRAATGPVNSYRRGCSTITRCARDDS